MLGIRERNYFARRAPLAGDGTETVEQRHRRDREDTRSVPAPDRRRRPWCAVDGRRELHRLTVDAKHRSTHRVAAARTFYSFFCDQRAFAAGSRVALHAVRHGRSPAGPAVSRRCEAMLHLAGGGPGGWPAARSQWDAFICRDGSAARPVGLDGDRGLYYACATRPGPRYWARVYRRTRKDRWPRPPFPNCGGS